MWLEVSVSRWRMPGRRASAPPVAITAAFARTRPRLDSATTSPPSRYTEVTLVERRGGDVVAETKHGSVRAKAAVMAAGGALARLPGMHHRLTVTSSHIVITEPVPDVLEEIGWTGGECITDSRAMVHYFRTTPDGRIAFGWAGAGSPSAPAWTAAPSSTRR